MKRDMSTDAAGSGAPLMEKVTRTTCPYCGVGCGILAKTTPEGSVRIEGDPDHPANFGRLCAKGSALAETLSLDDRLLTPMIGDRVADWSEALDLAAQTFREAIDLHGPDSVAFYVSGQLLTEDYYVANKLMKGFIGSANIDTNSRLCMASAVAGHKRAFGSDTVPGCYEDFELADLVVLVGSNLAWCHPVLHQRLMAAKAARPDLTIVTIDPRRTATADMSDLHLPICSGGDVALFNGLLVYLADHGHLDNDFISRHTEGFAASLQQARQSDSLDSGLDPARIAAFFELFASREKVVTAFSMGVNQSVTGTDKVNAILNCHLATGRIGKPGASAFSITGQPNAMGGREVGGLANQLAAHGDLADPGDRAAVRAFWNAPRMADKPGLMAVDLFKAVEQGTIKAILIMGTNPVVSMPDADQVVRALKACPFVVVVDVTARTDTAQHADVLLPALAWGEKSGSVTNSERRISRQRAFLNGPGAARADWWILSEIARRMGFQGFDFDGPAGIFAEHAGLSAVMADRGRDFDISGLAGLSARNYENLVPTQWPVPAEGSGRSRFFADGRGYHSSGKLRFVAVDSNSPAPDSARPFLLNTGRIRDQWHTMTRTGKSARLMAHIAEPFCEINSLDAKRLGVEPAGLVRVTSDHGSVLLRAQITDRVAPGSIFAPMHWTGQFTTNGRVGRAIAPFIDAISGQPGLKAARVSVEAAPMGHYGFAVCLDKPDVSGLEYAALAPASGGYRLEFAGRDGLEKGIERAKTAFASATSVDVAEQVDLGGGYFRRVMSSGGRLVAALWLSSRPVGVSRGYVVDKMTERELDLSLLPGRAGTGREDCGALICGCFNVGRKTIETEIRTTTDASLASIGKALGAGTGCGSCRPEIVNILKSMQLAAHR